MLFHRGEDFSGRSGKGIQYQSRDGAMVVVEPGECEHREREEGGEGVRGGLSGRCGVVATLPSASALAGTVWTNCHHPAAQLFYHTSQTRSGMAPLLSSFSRPSPLPVAKLLFLAASRPGTVRKLATGGSEQICAGSWQMEDERGFNEETGPDSVDSRMLPNPEDSHLLLEFAHRRDAGALSF